MKKRKKYALLLGIFLLFSLAQVFSVYAQEEENTSSSQGITVQGTEAYVQIQITEGSLSGEVLKAAKNQYENSAPEIVYYKEIQYQDTRDDSPYHHKKMISLTFPVPDGYDSLVNPKIVTYVDGQLRDLSPERQGDRFYIQRARTLENIVILSVPVALSAIQIQETASLNPDQKLALQPVPVPAEATESYTLEWFSSNPQIVEVDTSGIMTGISPGSCTITATVKENSQIYASCEVSVVQGTLALNTSVAQAIEEVRAYMLSVDTNPTIGSEWFVIGLARSGMDLNDPYFSTYYNHFANYLEENGGKLTNSVKYTEYSKAVLTVTAMGKDAENIAGYNLFSPLADFEKVTAQGINGPIWALIALNSSPAYTIPQDPSAAEQTTEERLIAYILSQETKSGGWSLSGDTPETDLTAMALQAFAPYYQRDGYEEVTAAVDRSLNLLGRMQNLAGGFSSWGVETVESAVQVLTALSCLGIDAQQDERFIKGGHWLAENILSYQIDGSGFMHVKEGAGNNGGGAAGEVNGMATEQGYYSLVAYQRMLDGQTGIYDMSDLQVTEGEKGDGSGSGLATPTPVCTPTRVPSRPGGQASQPGQISTSAPNSTILASTSSFGTAVATPTPAAARTVTATPTLATARAAATTPTPAAATSGASVTRSTVAPATTVAASSSQKRNKEKNETTETEEGWNFEAADYAEEETAEWDFDGAKLKELPPEEVPAENPEKGGLPTFVWGFFGGLIGAGLPRGKKYLWKKQK